MKTQRVVQGLFTILLLMVTVASASAQSSPTPEGTVIKNRAAASWTDANGNAYTPVTDSVTVTVGFKVGVDVTSTATATPSSPSTGNTQSFTLNNTGNGSDTLLVAVSTDAGITITSYHLNGTSYATLADLNTALATAGVQSGSSILVDVAYSVAAGAGGNPMNLTLTATSRRDGTGTDTFTTVVTPDVSSGVSVAPDGSLVDRLPSNGNSYTATYTVLNSGNTAVIFDVAATTTGSAVNIVSVNGIAGSTLTLNILSGASSTVTVIYTVQDVVAGSTDLITLTATSQASAAVTDDGTITVTVIRPNLTMDKVAYMNDQVTALGAGAVVVPGQYIQYRIMVANSGTADAGSVEVSDPIPSQLTYDSAEGDLAGWTFTNTAGTLVASLTGVLPPGGSRYFWIRVSVK